MSMLLVASIGENPMISSAEIRSLLFARELNDLEIALVNADMPAMIFARIPAVNAIPVISADPMMDAFYKILEFMILSPNDDASLRSCDEDMADSRTDLSVCTSKYFDFDFIFH